LRRDLHVFVDYVRAREVKRSHRGNALSKADAMSADAIKQQVARLKRAAKKTPLVVSAVSGDGVADVLRALWKVIEAARRGNVEASAADAAWHP